MSDLTATAVELREARERIEALTNAILFFRIEAERAKEHFGDLNGDWSAYAFVELVREQVDAMPWEPGQIEDALQQSETEEGE